MKKTDAEIIAEYEAACRERLSAYEEWMREAPTHPDAPIYDRLERACHAIERMEREMIAAGLKPRGHFH